MTARPRYTPPRPAVLAGACSSCSSARQRSHSSSVYGIVGRRDRSTPPSGCGQRASRGIDTPPAGKEELCLQSRGERAMPGVGFWIPEMMGVVRVVLHDHPPRQRRAAGRSTGRLPWPRMRCAPGRGGGRRMCSLPSAQSRAGHGWPSFQGDTRRGSQALSPDALEIDWPQRFRYSARGGRGALPIPGRVAHARPWPSGGRPGWEARRRAGALEASGARWRARASWRGGPTHLR
jgi:hypothetical protein